MQSNLAARDDVFSLERSARISLQLPNGPDRGPNMTGPEFAAYAVVALAARMENPVPEFAMTCHPRRNLALRYAEGSAAAPVAPIAQQGKSSGKDELRTG
ncbi:hypothetical protein ABIB68_008211 [Bradyrhizobium sp. F1.2.2]